MVDALRHSASLSDRLSQCSRCSGKTVRSTWSAGSADGWRPWRGEEPNIDHRDRAASESRKPFANLESHHITGRWSRNDGAGALHEAIRALMFARLVIPRGGAVLGGRNGRKIALVAGMTGMAGRRCRNPRVQGVDSITGRVCVHEPVRSAAEDQRHNRNGYRDVDEMASKASIHDRSIENCRGVSTAGPAMIGDRAAIKRGYCSVFYNIPGRLDQEKTMNDRAMPML